MTQHYVYGRAMSVEHQSNFTNESFPAWGFQVSGADEPSLRHAVERAAVALELSIEWSVDDTSSFELGGLSGSLVSPSDWLFYWMGRLEVEGLLAVMSGGLSRIPSSDGEVFEVVDAHGAATLVREFLNRIQSFATTGDAGGSWQLVFSELTHGSAERVGRAMSACTDEPFELIDPREKYLFLCDRETALMVLAMTSAKSTYVANGVGEAFDATDTEEARETLEAFLADDLALFLDVSYPLAIEISHPVTAIPLL